MANPEPIIIQLLKDHGMYSTTVLDFNERDEYIIISRAGGNNTVHDVSKKVRSKEIDLVISAYTTGSNSVAISILDNVTNIFYDELFYLDRIADISISTVRTIPALGNKKASSMNLTVKLQ